MQWVCKKFQPVDCVHTLNREWTLYKRMWVTKSQATLESDCHSTNLFLSVHLWCRLGPTKKRKRNCSEWVEYFGHWTVFICWTESGLCTREYGWLRANPHWHQTVTQQNLFASLNLWCKDLVPQKRGKGIAVSDLNVLATGLSLYTE